MDNCTLDEPYISIYDRPKRKPGRKKKHFCNFHTTHGCIVARWPWRGIGCHSC